MDFTQLVDTFTIQATWTINLTLHFNYQHLRTFHEEPSLEMKRCDLTWSILSTEIDYTTNQDNSPYAEMNTSNLYSKLQEDEQLIIEDSSDQWDERFEEVTCSLHCSHKFDDTNDVSTIWEVTWLEINQEHSQLTIIFLLMAEECQKHIFLMELL